MQKVQASDTGERQVLLEAIGAFEDWTKRLPADTPWAETFSGLRSDLALYLDPLQRMHEARDAERRAA